MIKKLILAALMLPLAGCVTFEERRDNFERDMTYWVGHHLDELIQRKGPPTTSATLSDNRKVIEYSSAFTEVTQQSMPHLTPVFVRNSQGGGSWIYVRQEIPLGPVSHLRNCKILFTVAENGLIEKWTAEGNSCF